MTKVLILDGHPSATSLSHTFAATYAEAAAKAGHDVRVVHLADLAFDPDFQFAAYKQSKPLEPCLEQFVADLEWSEHFVLLTPLWWGGLPAKLKGLFDRTLLPGRAFDPRKRVRGLPTPLLAGRTARVIITADTPGFFLRFAYGNAIIRQLRGQILGFVGIKPSRFTLFSGATDAPAGRVEKWVGQVRGFAATAS